MRALQPNLDLAPHPLECGGSTCLRHVEKLTPPCCPQLAAGAPSKLGASKAGASSRTPSGLAKVVLLAGIRLYQAFVSPLAFSACKFHPSCSRYAYEAIERHGARRGVRLALERLWRCRPFAPGGYDPVPESLEEVQ